MPLHLNCIPLVEHLHHNISSLAVDGSSDTGTESMYPLVVRIYDVNRDTVSSNFWHMYLITDCGASGISTWHMCLIADCSASGISTWHMCLIADCSASGISTWHMCLIADCSASGISTWHMCLIADCSASGISTWQCA